MGAAFIVAGSSPAAHAQSYDFQIAKQLAETFGRSPTYGYLAPGVASSFSVM